MEGWLLYKEDSKFLKKSYAVARLMETAKTEGIHLKIVSPKDIDITVTWENRKSIHLKGELVPLPDFIIPRMGAYTTYFDLAVIRHLERLGVRSFNTSESIEIVKDKLYSHQILAEYNMPVPKTMLVKFPVDVDFIEKNLGFPVIVKTLSGSQGVGVFLCETKRNLADMMQLVESTNINANIILQEFIKSSKGRDLRVFTLGGRVLGCVERVAKEGDFKANYSQGGEVRAFELTPEIEWLALEVSRAFNLDIAGIDLLFDGSHFKVCEANSAPGFETIEKCLDMDVAKEIFHFLRVRLGNFRKK
ncbi:RimK family alpha-L-glutamate ligase [Halobacteriovorax sp. JY17]|uniref:ATP-grasp domain-containing protein n=1 Tax=Halobacteriovorax sp. JY17 TaxID=2014617 RepID=UPI000C3668B1|nr:RimK family alpha-L-glutamate ligase [Halobacteriovorax sp. JY17]PIK16378.1 MAG: alpha-L-glutamate ligase [Halobacteriovorax sp. JY17]